MTISIEFVKADDAGVVPGSGWVLKENGKRIDWPMCSTRDEAIADAIEFKKSRRQLASDEAGEGIFAVGVWNRDEFETTLSHNVTLTAGGASLPALRCQSARRQK
jgi:hypothetical protein